MLRMSMVPPKAPIPEAVPAGAAAPLDFAAQFRRSFRVLWHIAVGIVGDHAAAEDVVQEAAIVALGKRDQFQPGTNFTAWMGQMVRYCALNLARKEKKHRAKSNDPDLIAATPGDAPRFANPSGGEAADVRNRFDQDVELALSEVSDIARACLLLRTLDGLEYSAISELLDIPEGTAMSHVHRTRKFLRGRLAHMDPQNERAGGGST